MTSWKRKGYRIDGCMNWFTGVKKGSPIYDVWQEVGAFTDNQIFYPEVFSITKVGGKTLSWYREL